MKLYKYGDIYKFTTKKLNIVRSVKNKLYSFALKPVWGKFGMSMKRVRDKCWCPSPDENSFIYLHEDDLPKLVTEITNNNEKPEKVKVIDSSDEMEVDSEITCEYVDSRVPREFQSSYIEDALKHKRYVIVAKPGSGKTFMGGRIINRVGKPTLILVLAKYTGMWKKNIEDMFDKPSVYVVKGLSGLAKLSELEDKPEFIIMPTRTFKMFMDDFEANGKSKLIGTTPERFTVDYGIGLVLLDESHNEFHVIYKAILYLRTKVLALSGTFESRSDYTLNKMNALFPKENRTVFEKEEPHIHFLAVEYKLKLKNYEYSMLEPISGYSENTHEAFMYGPKRDVHFKPIDTLDLPLGVENVYNEEYKDFMYDLLDKYLTEYYIVSRKKGDKVLIYFNTVAACKLAEEYINLNYDVICVKYTQEDEYSIIEKADVITSTAKSSGEGFDIDGLLTVLCFPNISSSVVNRQMCGRLRKRDEKVTFVYFYNSLIKKHVTYHGNRKRLFEVDAASYKTITES